MSETTGERLRRLRGNRTLVEISTALGIAPSTLSMYERGERTPRDAMKRKISQFYGKSVAYIFFGDHTRKM